MRLKFVILLAFIMTSFGASSGQTGLVAHWSFDELNGDIIPDASGNRNNGTNYGADIVQGIKGNALSFNGTSDYARIPGDGALPPSGFAKLGQGSISLWFKVNHIPTNFGIAPILYYGAEEMCDYFDAANQGLIIELGHSPVHQKSEALYFTIWKNGCTNPSFCFDSANRMPMGVWHHIAVVVGEDFNTGYLNGKELTRRSYNFGTRYDSQFFEDAIAHEKLWLGKGHWDRTTQYFDGELDEVKIFDRPLTGAEVTALYNDIDYTSVSTLHSETENHITIYPNPVTETLYFDLKELDKNIQDIRLTDLSGRVLLHKTGISSPGTISIGNLSEGLYYIEFSGDKCNVKKPVLVKH